jgi:hypothetical protein
MRRLRAARIGSLGEDDESAVAASPDRGTPDEASEAGG